MNESLSQSENKLNEYVQLVGTKDDTIKSLEESLNSLKQASQVISSVSHADFIIELPSIRFTDLWISEFNFFFSA